jgi:hypothetical protein
MGPYRGRLLPYTKPRLITLVSNKMLFDLFIWNGHWECVEYWVAHFTCVFAKREAALHRSFSFLGICRHLSSLEDGQVPEFRGLLSQILPSG